MISLLLTSFLLFMSPSSGDDLPLLTSKDLPGWEISKTDFYSKDQLFGYINGGAEVYLEYGFSRVAAQTLTQKDIEIQVDIYRMTNPSSAFGMFSISRNKCSSGLRGAAWSCVSKYRVMFTRGAYLVNVMPMNGGNKASDAARKAAGIVLIKTEGSDFKPPKLFSASATKSMKPGLRYMRGPLAVANSAPDWDSRLSGLKRFDMYLGKSGKGKSAVYTAELSFKSVRDAEKFLGNSGFEKSPAKGKWLQSKDGTSHIAVRKRSDKRFEFVESDSKSAFEKMLSVLK